LRVPYSPFGQKAKGSQKEIFEKKVTSSLLYIYRKRKLMEPFIHFRSQTINGDITLTFDMSNDKSRKVLQVLAKQGALTSDTIEKLNMRGML